MWEVVAVVVLLGGSFIYLLMRLSKDVGAVEHDAKARKAQQSKAAAADKARAVPLRRGSRLLDKLRSFSKRG